MWRKAPTGVLTAHFHWQEDHVACKHCGKIPSVEACKKTAQWLEMVREEVYSNRPMHIISFCRCPAHNRNVGGAPLSEHLRAYAVDYTVEGLTVEEAWKLAAKHQGSGKLIGGLGQYEGWVHIDRGRSRRWEGA